MALKLIIFIAIMSTIYASAVARINGTEIDSVAQSPHAISTGYRETVDTLAAQKLQEVIVQAPNVIYKADMEAYYPSHSTVGNSQNDMQLLNNLMIPSLTVNDELGQVQAASVQVHINTYR